MTGLENVKTCKHVDRPHNHRGEQMMRCVLCHRLRKAQLQEEHRGR